MPFVKRIDKNLLYTFILIVLLLGGLSFFSTRINDTAMQNSLQQLQDAAHQLAISVYANVNRDMEQLTSIADMISAFDDLTSSEVTDIICSFEDQTTISTLGLLLPDNTFILCDGNFQNNLLYDYETEVAQAPRVSGITISPKNSDDKFLSYAVPVIQNNTTVAILYGFVPLDVLPGLFSTNILDADADIYLVDGDSGDFIVNTWHEELGNIHDPDYTTRDTKGDYSFEQLRNDVMAGVEGKIVFLSEGRGEYLLTYYTPVGINNWSVALTIAESAAYDFAYQIQKLQSAFIILCVILLLIYFLLILLHSKRLAKRKDLQLNQMLYMLDIQQTLFDIHQKPERISEALQKCANAMSAEAAFLVSLQEENLGSVFLWDTTFGSSTSSIGSVPLDDAFPTLGKHLLEFKSVLIDDTSKLEQNMSKDLKTLEQHQRLPIYNIIFTPVPDARRNKLIGLLGVANLDQMPADASQLECVVFSFFMALNNMVSYEKIKEMGTIDMLTGLMNRNKYQNDVLTYEKTDCSICCLYLDANGLHELNNHLGHAAGDKMLCYIGDTLKNIFGAEHAYRIGGDEFVVLYPNFVQEQVADMIRTLKRRLKSQHYHVSVGSAYQQNTQNINLLISEAEQQMYKNKRRYYKKKGDVTKARDMNQKLEQILLEKKDYDSFLSIIASYFYGVYVTNLETDITRGIYKPAFFDKLLQSANFHFLPAMYKYIDDYVRDEDQMAFYHFLDYDSIKKLLKKGTSPTFFYIKKDGTHLKVTVHASMTSPAGEIEVFWLFQETTL